MDSVLHLRKQTPVSKLLQGVEVPNRAVSLPQTPGLENVPLHQKVPIHFRAATFTRETLGNDIWKQLEGDFASYDPNLLHFKFKYNPLHDPHLKKFFEIPIYKKKLLELHDIHARDEVFCSLKDFNLYRQFLYRLGLALSHRKIKKQDEILAEKRDFELACRKLMKEADKAHTDSFKRTKDEIITEKFQKRRKLLEETQMKYFRTIRKYYERKRIEALTSNCKRELRNLRQRNRIKTLSEKERRNQIDLILKLQQKSFDFEESRKWTLDYKRRMKEFRMAALLERKLAFREYQAQLEQESLNQYYLEMEENVRKRQESFERKFNRLENEFLQRRADRIRQKYEHSGHEGIKKALLSGIARLLNKKRKARICQVLSSHSSGRDLRHVKFNAEDLLKAIQKKKDVDLTDLDEELLSEPEDEKSLQKLTPKLVGSAVEQAFTVPDYSVNAHGVLQLANEMLHSKIETPHSVLPCDSEVLGYVETRVREIIVEIKGEIMQELERLSVRKPPSSHSTSSKKTVRFEEPRKFEDEHEFHERPPTPITSLSTLTSIVLSEGREEAPVSEPASLGPKLVHLSQSQKKMMERNCALFRTLLKSTCEKRCVAAINFKEKRLRKNIRQDLFGIDRGYLVDLLAHSILKLPLEDLNFGSNIQLATSVICAEILAEFSFTKERGLSISVELQTELR